MAGPKVFVYNQSTSSWREVPFLYVYDSNISAWRQVNKAWVNDGGGTNWRLTYQRTVEYIISADVNNFNLRNFLISQGWTGTTPISASITINSGVVVGSTTTSGYAFDTGTFPSGSSLQLTNNGRIAGAGGAGGYGSPYPRAGGPPGPGGAGGPAVRAQFPITIINNGVIAGGGGGGGGGCNTGCGECYDDPGGGGGGGAGRVGGAGGVVFGKPACYQGSPGTLLAGGLYGSPCATSSREWANGFRGGIGGGPGLAGEAGQGPYGGAGGAAGYYALGNANIVWSVIGTRLGNVT